MIHSRRADEDAETGVARVSEDGRFLDVDQQIARILGRDVNDIKRLTFQDVTHPDDLFRDQAQVERLLAKGEGSYSLLKRYIHGSNKPVWVELCVTLNPREHGRPAEFTSRLRPAQICEIALEEVHKKAFQDATTGIANRHALEEQILASARRAKRTGAPFVFACLDLDRFKQINDSLGHQAGDMLLKAVSQRLNAAIRTDDFVARMGGDEFAVLLQGVRREADLRARVAKIRQRLMPVYDLPGGPVQITASLGWALFPHEADTIPDLMNMADRAMYRAKRAIVSEQSRLPSPGLIVPKVASLGLTGS